jgi:hypothetical protein
LSINYCFIQWALVEKHCFVLLLKYSPKFLCTKYLAIFFAFSKTRSARRLHDELLPFRLDPPTWYWFGICRSGVDLRSLRHLDQLYFGVWTVNTEQRLLGKIPRHLFHTHLDPIPPNFIFPILHIFVFPNFTHICNIYCQICVQFFTNESYQIFTNICQPNLA